MAEERRRNPDIRWAGDRALRIEVGDDPGGDVPGRVRALYETLRDASVPGVRALIPAYTTVLVEIDPATAASPAVEDRLRAIVEGASGPAPRHDASPPPVEIPVCYEGEEMAPDLRELSSLLRLTEAEIVRRHAAGLYLVHFLGFMPGFPYLGGLDPSLAAPRLPTPRTRVPAGSVAIGGSQTGVYPFPSPGGWRILGRTPAVFYDPGRDPRALLRMGDRVRFVPVSRTRFEAMRREGGP
jgi:KipI family sensor histidine kinase inhibitor